MAGLENMSTADLKMYMTSLMAAHGNIKQSLYQDVTRYYRRTIMSRSDTEQTILENASELMQIRQEYLRCYDILMDRGIHVGAEPWSDRLYPNSHVNEDDILHLS